jgi:hypothetical protein
MVHLEMDPDKAIRIILKFKVQSIPGDPPSRRANILVNAFLDQHFQREFRFGHDWMHVPCNIDSPKGSAILIIDVNAKTNLAVTADNVRLCCYLAEPTNTINLPGDQAPENPNKSLCGLLPMLRTHFLHVCRHFRATHLFDIRHYSSMFPWGGKTFTNVQSIMPNS